MPTNEQLSQLIYLRIKIRQQSERLAKLRARATSMCSSANGTGHGNCKSDKTGIAADIVDLSKLIEADMLREIKLERELTSYIASVEDRFIQVLLTYRYINDMSWDDIAAKLGHNYSSDLVRKSVSRFLAKNESCPQCHKKNDIMVSWGDCDKSHDTKGA